MTLLSVKKDSTNLMMTFTAKFDSPVERVWQVWSDPRQLERWWGPPAYPATVVEHALAPGARVSYCMTGPNGEKYPGWWRVSSVEAPCLLEFEDGFSDGDGEPDNEMPNVRTRVSLTGASSGKTTMTLVSSFASLEQMEQILAMGAEEGMIQALGQIDDILASPDVS